MSLGEHQCQKKNPHGLRCRLGEGHLVACRFNDKLTPGQCRFLRDLLSIKGPDLAWRRIYLDGAPALSLERMALIERWVRKSGHHPEMRKARLTPWGLARAKELP